MNSLIILYFSEPIYYWTMLIALAASIIFILLLRWFVTFVTYTVITLFGIALLVASIHALSIYAGTAEDFATPLTYSALFIFYVVFVIYFRRAIKISCECIREASKYDEK